MVKIIKPEEIEGSRGSAGHGGVVAKFLVDKNIGAEKLSLVMGELLPGGLVEPHRHEDNEHCYYILKGEVIIIDDEGRKKVKEGMVCWIGMNELHGMTNETQESAVYLAMGA